MHPTANPPSAGRMYRGTEDPAEPVGEAVEGGDIEPTHEAGGEAEQGVVDEWRGSVNPRPATRPKIGAKPTNVPNTLRRRRSRRRRRDERLRVDIVAERDLGRQDGPTQWRTEDRADPGAHAGAHRDPGISRIQVEEACQV